MVIKQERASLTKDKSKMLILSLHRDHRHSSLHIHNNGLPPWTFEHGAIWVSSSINRSNLPHTALQQRFFNKQIKRFSFVFNWCDLRISFKIQERYPWHLVNGHEGQGIYNDSWCVWEFRDTRTKYVLISVKSTSIDRHLTKVASLFLYITVLDTASFLTSL